MKLELIPPRGHGTEILDDPGVDPGLVTRSMRDVARANALFGGRRAINAELESVLRTISGNLTMLDVGTGLGDIPARAVQTAAARGVRLRTIGIDMSFPLLEANRKVIDHLVQGDALALPFLDQSIDIVMASQVLHHFSFESAVVFVREMNRVAREAVIISDLRRSRVAAAGIWLGSFPLGFHPVSRHDGVVSVMRGFRTSELAEIVVAATGRESKVNRRIAYRLTTSWKPR